MLVRFRDSIRNGNYRISAHALEETADDDLLAADLEQIVLTGRIVRRQTRDPRGVRYVLRGRTADGREGCIVGRFAEDGALLIITAYVPED